MVHEGPGPLCTLQEVLGDPRLGRVRTVLAVARFEPWLCTRRHCKPAALLPSLFPLLAHKGQLRPLELCGSHALSIPQPQPASSPVGVQRPSLTGKLRPRRAARGRGRGRAMPRSPARRAPPPLQIPVAATWPLTDPARVSVGILPWTHQVSWLALLLYCGEGPSCFQHHSPG